MPDQRQSVHGRSDYAGRYRGQRNHRLDPFEACHRNRLDRNVLKLELDRNVPQLGGFFCCGKYAGRALSEDLCAVLVAHGLNITGTKAFSPGRRMDLRLGPFQINLSAQSATRELSVMRDPGFSSRWVDPVVWFLIQL